MSAHGQLLQSDPSPGSIVASAPHEVTLVFSEPVTPAGAGIRAYAPSGRQVAGPAVPRGAVLEATLDSTEQGTFVVVWQVFAVDTHPSRGVFAFSVGHASPNPFAALLSAPAAGTATPVGLALQALAHLLHFAGFALAFGIAAYVMLAGRSELPTRLVAGGVALLIAAEPLSLVAQLASLSFDGDTALAVLGSTFGRLFGLRLAAALLAWTLLATGRPWPLVAIGAIEAALDGVGAHAIGGVPVVGQVLVAVHVAAMGAWLGGLIVFVRRPDPRFARYALSTFGVAVATGVALGVAHTRLGEELLTTDYGWVLGVKALVVAAVIALGVAGRRRAELAVAAGVVAAATVLAALPPPL